MRRAEFSTGSAHAGAGMNGKNAIATRPYQMAPLCMNIGLGGAFLVWTPPNYETSSYNVACRP